MSTKAKRGLGLLVVALLCFLAMAVTVSAAGGTDPSAGASVVVLLTAIGCAGCAVAGLVLLAWGLLRD